MENYSYITADQTKHPPRSPNRDSFCHMPLETGEQHFSTVGTSKPVPTPAQMKMRADNCVSAKKSRDKRKREFDRLRALEPILVQENRNLRRMLQGYEHQIAHLTKSIREQGEQNYQRNVGYLDPYVQAHGYQVSNYPQPPVALQWNGNRPPPQGNTDLTQMHNGYMIPAPPPGNIVGTLFTRSGSDQMVINSCLSQVSFQDNNAQSSRHPTPRLTQPQPTQHNMPNNDIDLEHRDVSSSTLIPSPDSGFVDQDSNLSRESKSREMEDVVEPPLTPHQPNGPVPTHENDQSENTSENGLKDLVSDSELQSEDFNALFAFNQMEH